MIAIDPDIVFVSYDEPNADENYERLRTLAPRAKRLHGVKGIYAAYQAAADLSNTPYFFMVDADSWVLDAMRFEIPGTTFADIYSWPSVNAVNRLISRNGSVKLMRRRAVRTLQPDAVDFFASMTGRRRIIQTLASENRFNSSPFLTWRGAYRECAKLAAGSVNDPSGRKLNIWQTRGGKRTFGAWSLIGARMGAQMGRTTGSAALAGINDEAFLRETFERFSGSASLPETLLDQTPVVESAS